MKEQKHQKLKNQIRMIETSKKDSPDTSKDLKEETTENNKKQNDKGIEDTSKETEVSTKPIKNPTDKSTPIPGIENEITIEEAIERVKIGTSFRQINKFKYHYDDAVEFYIYGLISKEMKKNENIIVLVNLIKESGERENEAKEMENLSKKNLDVYYQV